VPLATPEETVTLKVDEVVAGFGEKLPVAPLGKPLIDKATAELKPFERVILTV
jgi:hypothetical protein